jgi:Streptomyces sporulation and cell division protein, SsgA
MGEIYQHEMYVSAMDNDHGYSPWLPIRWEYDTADPFAIKLIFTNVVDEDRDGEDVEWCFARDTLASGLVSDTPHGIGDIKVWKRLDGKLAIALDSPEGNATLAMERAPVMRFTRRIYNAVPEGFELNFVDIDAAIASLTV